MDSDGEMNDSSHDEDDAKKYPRYLESIGLDDKKVSAAPLHIAYKSRHNIPKLKLQQLIDEGYEIRRGRFTRKENKRLIKNWDRICRKYPKLNNPFAAVGLTFKPTRSSGFIRDTIIDPKLRQLFRDAKIMERLAYKLDNRLICDIYSRAKKVIGGKAFKYNSRTTIPEELDDDAVMRLFDSKEQISSISTELDINPYVVSSMKISPTKLPPHRFTKQDDLLLEMSIERQFCNADPRKIPLHMIDWKKIEKEMTQCGYNLTAMKLYKRWYKLNRVMAKDLKTHLVESVELEPCRHDL